MIAFLLINNNPKSVFYGPYVIRNKGFASRFYELFYILRSFERDKSGFYSISFSTKFKFLNFYKFSTEKISDIDFEKLKSFLQ